MIKKIIADKKKKIIVHNNSLFTSFFERSIKDFFDFRKNTQNIFYKYGGENIDGLIRYEDTSNVTKMNNMFDGCTNLQTIPQLDTSNVTNMSYMFFDCENLQTIPQLDTSKVWNMDRMFYDCNNLQTINITSMDKVTSTNNSYYMCYDCHSLKKFIICNMTTIPSLNANSFSSCYHFTGTSNDTYNPEGLKDGRIYVPDNMVESLKSATNWSKYADIIVGTFNLPIQAKIKNDTFLLELGAKLENNVLYLNGGHFENKTLYL